MNTNNVVIKETQETVNSVLIDILRGAKEVGKDIYVSSKHSITAAVDFAQEQAPLVVQEFLNWKFYEALIVTIANTGLLVISICVLYWSYKTIKSAFENIYVNEQRLFAIFPGIGAFFCLFISIGNILTNFKNLIKIQIAPRIYIIEYVSDQLTK